jgi:integrase
MTPHPIIPDTPGLVWRPHAKGWKAFWQCRTDLVNKGFTPKSILLWSGSEPPKTEIAFIQDRCRRLQDEMLLFGRGGFPQANPFDGSLRSLINCYQTDTDSRYHKKRYHVRRQHDSTLKRIADRHGHEELADIKGRILIAWHKDWSDGELKLSMGQAFIQLLRALFVFGATILEDEECDRLCNLLHKMRFKMPRKNTESLTADQVASIIAEAHKIGWHSVAFAQAIQFETLLRQKDCIGELVPLAEPGTSDIIKDGLKWLYGLRWSEVDANLVLTHETSKKDKPLEVSLIAAPMVAAELARIAGVPVEALSRGMFPASGPIIVAEDGLPFTSWVFRKRWRLLANIAGIPKSGKNMHSRSAGISEAEEAGAPIDHIRRAATHSDAKTTDGYIRLKADANATKNVMQMRAAHRNKPKDQS